MNKTTNVTKMLTRLVETKAEVVKLGMDVHARDVVVCVQLDGALPQRPQKMTAAEVLVLVRGLLPCATILPEPAPTPGIILLWDLDLVAETIGV